MAKKEDKTEEPKALTCRLDITCRAVEYICKSLMFRTIDVPMNDTTITAVTKDDIEIIIMRMNDIEYFVRLESAANRDIRTFKLNFDVKVEYDENNNRDCTVTITRQDDVGDPYPLLKFSTVYADKLEYLEARKK